MCGCAISVDDSVNPLSIDPSCDKVVAESISNDSYLSSGPSQSYLRAADSPRNHRTPWDAALFCSLPHQVREDETELRA